MASGETEDPKDVADGFAVGIAVGHKFISPFLVEFFMTCRRILQVPIRQLVSQHIALIRA
jgi:hypothetical protein